MNAFKKLQASIDAKKQQINDKLAESKEKKEKALAESVSDATSQKSSGRNPYPQEGKVAFSIENMEEYSHEELQIVIKMYDKKTKEYKAQHTEHTQKISQLETSLSQATSEMNDSKLTTEMQKAENQTLKEVLDTQSKEVESLKNLCKLYEEEGEKNDELESKLENITQLYQKEKELNESLINQSKAEDGGSQAVEQVFKQKYEAECD